MWIAGVLYCATYCEERKVSVGVSRWRAHMRARAGTAGHVWAPGWSPEDEDEDEDEDGGKDARIG